MKAFKQYTVWVGAGEVNTHLLSKVEAEALALEWLSNGYDDVQVEEIAYPKREGV